MYAGQYGMWKVAGLVRNSADMGRLAHCLCTDGKWRIDGAEMVITTPTDVEIARLKLEDSP